MPFVLVTIGVVLLVASIRNTQGPGPGTLFTLVAGDFTGPNNFVYWFLAMMVIGMIGYVPKLKSFSIAMLSLVLVVLFLKKGTGFFSQFQSALSQTQTATANLGTAGSSAGATSAASMLSGLPSLASFSSPGSGGILGTGQIPSSGAPVLINNTGSGPGVPNQITTALPPLSTYFPGT